MGQGGTRHFTISSNATETRVGTGTNTPLILTTNDTTRLTIAASTGAATFSSTVTAGGNFTTTADGGDGGLRLTLNNTGAGEVQYALLSGGSAGTGIFGIRNGSVGSNLFLMNGAGAATFNGTLNTVGLLTGQASIYQADPGGLIASNRWGVYNGGSTNMTFLYNPSGEVVWDNGSNQMKLKNAGDLSIKNGTITTGVSIAIAAINTAYVLKTGAYSGLVVIRDNTNGGSGVWITDPNMGTILIANNMPGAFTIGWNGTNTTITKTSGNTVNISVGFYSNILGF
jgi:hypothetical protein